MADEQAVQRQREHHVMLLQQPQARTARWRFVLVASGLLGCEQPAPALRPPPEQPAPAAARSRLGAPVAAAETAPIAAIPDRGPVELRLRVRPAPDDASAEVAIVYNSRDELRAVPIDRIELVSQGAYGHGESFTIDAQGRPVEPATLDLNPEFTGLSRLADFERQRPPGTALSVGVIHYGERAWFLFYVYHLIPEDGRRVRVVRQTWNGAAGEIDETETRTLSTVAIRE